MKFRSCFEKGCPSRQEKLWQLSWESYPSCQEKLCQQSWKSCPSCQGKLWQLSWKSCPSCQEKLFALAVGAFNIYFMDFAENGKISLKGILQFLV